MRGFYAWLCVLCLLAAAPWIAGCQQSTYRLGVESQDRAAESSSPVRRGMMGGYGDMAPGTTLGARGDGGDSGVAAPEASSADEQTAVELAALTDASQPPEQRILIYTAGLDIAVANVDAALADAQRLAEAVGGYLQAMSADTITLRVPAKQFFSVLDQFQALGRTLSKNIEALDVTDEYVDLKLRLKNAEAMRDRLLAILEQAKTVKDMLEVERELNRIREDIERIKGRLAVLEKQIAFSTVKIHFVKASATRAVTVLPATPFPWLDRLGVETVLGLGRQ